MSLFENIDEAISEINKKREESISLKKKIEVERREKLTERYKKLCELIEYSCKNHFKKVGFVTTKDTPSRLHHFNWDNRVRFTFDVNGEEYRVDVIKPDSINRSFRYYINIEKLEVIKKKKKVLFGLKVEKSFDWHEVIHLVYSKYSGSDKFKPAVIVEKFEVKDATELQKIVDHMLFLIDQENEKIQNEIDLLQANREIDRELPEINYGTF